MRTKRLLLVAGLSVWSTALAIQFWQTPQPVSDFAQVWYGSQAWLHGENPYALVGPGRAFDWPYPLLYPFTSLLVALPLTVLSMHASDVVFVTLTTILLAWGLTKEQLNEPRLLLFYSFPFLMALQQAQWSLPLTGAALVPTFGFLLICKPTIGMALFAAYPRWRSAIGCAMLGVLSVILFPSWISEWRIALQSAEFIAAPVLIFPGAVMLLSALRWRRPEGRLLLALTVLPHQPVLYEALLLFLVPATWIEAGILWGGTTLVALFGVGFVGTEAAALTQTRWLHWCAYLPCLIMVLRRPNTSQESVMSGSPLMSLAIVE